MRANSCLGLLVLFLVLAALANVAGEKPVIADAAKSATPASVHAPGVRPMIFVKQE